MKKMQRFMHLPLVQKVVELEVKECLLHFY